MTIPPSSESAPHSPRVLVFIVAYAAEHHLVSVFERIPELLLKNPNVDFLCIDDASEDAGARKLTDWLTDHHLQRVRVWRNPVNQGYGGNQKLGYTIAIEEDYAFVILLHGDGQYAPELLPRFIDTWRETGADVVLGSRMLSPKDARRGGMPLYKFVGNRMLTWFQNRLTGLGLAEYHTGYRGYSTRFLRQVKFAFNTNDFHFDTEILLQAAHIRARIVEFPIPTHYGEEVCHVPGLKYAFNVIMATVGFKLHQMGMFCSLKYRRMDVARYGDKGEVPYSSHRMALEHVVAMKPKRLLDIGCGSGHVASRCQQLGIEVTGVDRAVEPAYPLSAYFSADLETDPFPVDLSAFDMVLLLDVIEHLSEPERFLIDLRTRYLSGSVPETIPTVIVSTPNVAFIGVRLNLLLGRFPYAERGILDITHRRLFTRRSLIRALRDSGYQIHRVRAVPPPFERVVGGWIGSCIGWLTRMMAACWPGAFAFQFLVVCTPLPGVMHTLNRAEHFLGNKSPGSVKPCSDSDEKSFSRTRING